MAKSLGKQLIEVEPLRARYFYSELERSAYEMPEEQDRILRDLPDQILILFLVYHFIKLRDDGKYKVHPEVLPHFTEENSELLKKQPYLH